MPYSVRLSLFCVVCILCFLFLVFLFFYSPIKRFLYKKFTLRMYYGKVRRVVLDNDYYLINNFANKTADQETFHIDHIMIGDKYIYCIRDRYYDGAIAAKETDPSWIFYKGKKATYIKNPMLVNKVRVDRMSLMTGIDSKIFISIVLINDDCMMTRLNNTYTDNFIVSLKKFPFLIEQLESNDVSPLDPKSIAIAARDFSELNLNGKI
ncbi:MAG TPA: hypothetical protein DD377_04630 [Firmicutes bacterium]|nr:hypothetical protein [Bacillota bacterium]